MIGQTEVGEFAPVLAWLLAAAVTFGPGAIGITKLVDGLRSFDTLDTWPAWVWILAAFVIGVATCIVFELNLVGGLLVQLPAFAGSHVLDGVAGEVVTGIALAGTASYHHERMDLASSRAAAARALTQEELDVE